ncbi:MAG: bifunctional adenosylcobinamide kinase/adenosylcobinamide-phosphate guanylyltransferase [Campylobacterota bacterium]|nr:bifunctional adenosylcobinamide kinase/adenosylcobinamide-phosphate guanylyltransferase [Campylobacterota bacterium]
MKSLYYGGQKSGKSLLAEKRALALAIKKPYYIATYDNSYDDGEMEERISVHRLQRQDEFVSIEEPLDFSSVLKEGETYLVDCVSMWLLNTLEESEASVLAQVEAWGEMEANIVFVLNDVASGVIPLDKESRKYVDRSGVVGQKLASFCDEVFEVKLGLKVRLK